MTTKTHLSSNAAAEASPKEHRLFHYTSARPYLESLLREGIWPRYCIEEFDWLLDGNICIAFPVACFCDIPLSAAGEHKARYGQYAVALRKDSAGELDINPMWYLQEGARIIEHLKDVCDARPRITLDTIPDSLKPILPFLKSTIGGQPDRNAKRLGTFEIMAFEEELEWRHTPSTLIDTWKMGYGRESLASVDHDQSLAHRLALKPEIIDEVFVTNDAERNQIETTFPWLSGRVSIW